MGHQLHTKCKQMTQSLCTICSDCDTLCNGNGRCSKRNESKEAIISVIERPINQSQMQTNNITKYERRLLISNRYSHSKLRVTQCGERQKYAANRKIEYCKHLRKRIKDMAYERWTTCTCSLFFIVNESNQFHFKSPSETKYKHKSFNHPTNPNNEHQRALVMCCCMAAVVGIEGKDVHIGTDIRHTKYRSIEYVWIENCVLVCISRTPCPIYASVYSVYYTHTTSNSSRRNRFGPAMRIENISSKYVRLKLKLRVRLAAGYHLVRQTPSKKAEREWERWGWRKTRTVL